MLKHVLAFALKDFKIQQKNFRSYLIIALLMILMYSFMNIDQPQMIVFVVSFPIIYGFLNGALYGDEKNNTLRLLVSLPIKKDVIVYARYLSTFLLMLLYGLLFVVADRLFVVYGIWRQSDYTNALLISITLLTYLLLISVYLPLAFKLGYIRASSINRFIFVGLFAFFGAGAAALNGLFKGGPPKFVADLRTLFADLNINVLAVVIIGITLLVYLGSMRLAIIFFRKRNLF